MRFEKGLVGILVASAITASCSSSGGKAPRDGATDAPAADAAHAEDGAAGAAGTSGAAGGGGAGSGGVDGAASVDGAGTDAAGTDGAAGADGSFDGATDLAADGGVPGSFELKTPTFSVALSSESTQCVVLDLGNAQTIHVGHVKATISAPVYELRVGAVSGAVQTTPTACDPFGDVMDATVRPLMFARNDIEDLSFPTGVGYTLAAHQLLRFEIHAWNPTGDALPANASVIFTVSSDAAFQHEAGLMLLETTEIQISAHDTSTLGPELFTLGPTLGPASIFRLEGYTHELGTVMTMALASSATDPSPMSIYAPNPWNPTNPLVVDEATPFSVAAQGGITLTCTWNNFMGVNAVTRGSSVADERCAAFLSYYPAVTSHFCVHTGAGTTCM